MKTFTFLIGNSDNKLTQSEWSHFVNEVKEVLKSANELHFTGGSDWDAPWQNACFVGAAEPITTDILADEIKLIAKKYKQESVAFLCGDSKLIFTRERHVCGLMGYNPMLGDPRCPGCEEEEKERGKVL